MTSYIINLKSRFNFLKLPLIYTELCLQQVFENRTLGRNSPRGLFVDSALEIAEIRLEFVYVTRQLFKVA
jgi:hypothetical protein